MSNANTRNFGPPFDDDDADIVIRSSNGIDFQVHRLFLSKASPIFRDMLSIPQPTSTAPDSEDMKRGLPVVRMTEDAHSVEIMLRFCYPVAKPSSDKLGNLQAAWRVGKKFEMETVDEGSVRRMLALEMMNNPERVYAIAWILELKDIVVAAAKQTLYRPLLTGPYVQEFADVPATALFRLMEYHHSCLKAVKQLTTDFAWMELAAIPKPIDAQCPAGCKTHQIRKIKTNERVDVKDWWWEYLANMSCAFAENLRDWRMASARYTLLAVEKAAVCSGCRQRSISGAMEHFNKRFAEEVEIRISEVGNLL